MTTIVTRAGKGSPLTFTEADANFTNLNTYKYESDSATALSNANFTAAGVSPTLGMYSPSSTTLAWVIGSTEIARASYTASYSTVWGLGVTPTAWSNTILPVYAYQFGDRGAIYQFSGNTHIGFNNKVSSAYADVAITGSGTPALLSIGAGDITMKVAAANPGAGLATTFTTIATAKGTDNWFQVDCGQIKFPAVQSASTDANVLDDYEEGTWTPSDASGAGLSLTGDNCRYVKIGKLVTIIIGGITYPVTASGSNAVIGGLPFTTNSGGTWISGGCFSVDSTGTANTGYGLLLPANATTASVYSPTTNGTATNANLSNSTLFGLSFSYQASA